MSCVCVAPCLQILHPPLQIAHICASKMHMQDGPKAPKEPTFKCRKCGLDHPMREKARNQGKISLKCQAAYVKEHYHARKQVRGHSLSSACWSLSQGQQFSITSSSHRWPLSCIALPCALPDRTCLNSGHVLLHSLAYQAMAESQHAAHCWP